MALDEGRPSEPFAEREKAILNLLRFYHPVAVHLDPEPRERFFRTMDSYLRHLRANQPSRLDRVARLLCRLETEAASGHLPTDPRRCFDGLRSSHTAILSSSGLGCRYPLTEASQITQAQALVTFRKTRYAFGHGSRTRPEATRAPPQAPLAGADPGHPGEHHAGARSYTTGGRREGHPGEAASKARRRPMSTNATVVLDKCPHCDADQMTFRLIQHSHVKHPDRFALTNEARRYQGTRPVWNTFAQCQRCWKGVVLEIVSNGKSATDPAQAEGDLFSSFDLIEVHPKPAAIAGPEHVPDRIAKNYIEACGSLRRQSFTSAVMMFRKVLERATKELSPQGTDSLSKRIDDLANQNRITQAMRDWAHVIRLDGNEAVHDEDPDEPSAREIQQFTELFLLYSFTLPERVKLYHSQAAQNV